VQYFISNINYCAIKNIFLQYLQNEFHDFIRYYSDYLLFERRFINAFLGLWERCWSKLLIGEL